MHQLLIECRFYSFWNILSWVHTLLFFCKSIIVYVLFVHKKSVSKRKVCFIFIKLKEQKKPQKKIFSGFLGVFCFVFLGGLFYCQPCLQEVTASQADLVDLLEAAEYFQAQGCGSGSALIWVAGSVVDPDPESDPDLVGSKTFRRIRIRSWIRNKSFRIWIRAALIPNDPKQNSLIKFTISNQMHN